MLNQEVYPLFFYFVTFFFVFLKVSGSEIYMEIMQDQPHFRQFILNWHHECITFPLVAEGGYE